MIVSNIIFIFATTETVLTMRKLYLLTTAAVAVMSISVSSQTISLKNDLLYDVTLTPNIGIERMVGKSSSMQLFYGIHPWRLSDTRRLRHWSLMPEYRRWLSCHTPFTGHFVGIHSLGGEYSIANIGISNSIRNYQYEGWYIGGGLTYGYTWPLSGSWNIEAAVGIGFIHMVYDKYENATCGRLLDSGRHNYVGPTKLAMNLCYILGR